MKSSIAAKDHSEIQPWTSRKKVHFSLNTKKSQGELKHDNEVLSDKVTSLELEKKTLQSDMKKMEQKCSNKFTNNNLPDQEKVYKLIKLQKAKIEKLEFK